VPNCPPLEVRDGTRYFRVRDDGTGCTSSREPAGRYIPRYAYRDAERTELKETLSGAGGMIWGGFFGEYELQGRRFRYLVFFVGTEEEFKTHPAPFGWWGALP
jgi:hypothetical protein